MHWVCVHGRVAEREERECDRVGERLIENVIELWPGGLRSLSIFAFLSSSSRALGRVHCLAKFAGRERPLKNFQSVSLEFRQNWSLGKITVYNTNFL